MSRRLCRLLALLLTAGMLSGCGAKTPDPVMAGEGAFGAQVDSAVPSASAEPQPAVASTWAAGTFSMPVNNSYGWNPYSCIGMENRAVMQLIYEGLFTLNNQFDAEPMLCTEYTLSDDGYVYTLTLANATFSNGKTLTADDVVYSITQAKSSSLYSGRLIDIGSYYGDSEGHVIIEMYRPNDRLPCLLTFPIVPSFSNLETAPPGTGPFVRSSGESLTVNRADCVPATVTANNRTFDGTEQPLVTVNASTLAGGEMLFLGGHLSQRFRALEQPGHHHAVPCL